MFEWPGDCVDKAWGTTGHVPEMEGSTAAWWTRWKMRTVATWFEGFTMIRDDVGWLDDIRCKGYNRYRQISTLDFNDFEQSFGKHCDHFLQCLRKGHALRFMVLGIFLERCRQCH